MPLSKTPTNAIFPVWAVGECSEANDRFEPMVSPTAMRARSLFGIPLRSALDNSTVTDDTLQF